MLLISFLQVQAKLAFTLSPIVPFLCLSFILQSWKFRNKNFFSFFWKSCDVPRVHRHGPVLQMGFLRFRSAFRMFLNIPFWDQSLGKGKTKQLYFSFCPVLQSSLPKASANPVCNTWSTMAFGSGPALEVRWLRVHIPVSTSHRIWVTWGKVTLFIPGKIRGQQLMAVPYSVQGEEGSGQHLRFCYTHLKGNEVRGKARWVLCVWYW